MHLVDFAGRRVLLDCGIVRGQHAHGVSRTAPFPFAPETIDAVVLSHAHIDHCGNLPRLVRQGFGGPIFCTPATRDLVSLMLADSARIQEEDSRTLHILGLHEAPDVAFTRDDVEQARGQYVPIPYGEIAEILPGIRLRLANAGHILGSAMVQLRFDASPRETSLTFTGDLGRPGVPMLNGPDPVPEADLLLCESTNGGRRLPALADAVEQLETLVRGTIEREGKVLIPIFSLGRVQVMLHYLVEGQRAGRLPAVPIYVDSPLAADITAVYQRHVHSEVPVFVGQGAADPEDSHAVPAARTRTWDGEVHFVRALDESRELSQRRGPAIILAPGGMCEGTRIQNHLRANVDDPRCSVLLVTYQAPHSVGARLLEPGPTVRFQGKTWNRWADIIELAGFSGHPDEAELLDYLTPLAAPTRKVRMVHGEAAQSERLAQLLRERGFGDVAVPVVGETMTI
jgi:metallo-beta-lactamase family protein